MGGFTYDYFKQIHYRISQLLRISKRLNFKTLKSYRIDLNQYLVFCDNSLDFLSKTHWICILQSCINGTSPSPLSEKLQA